MHVVSSSSSQNTYTAKQFTGVEGSTVPLKDTIESFQMICNGDAIIPEQAFYNIGGMDDVMRRYEEIKAQTGLSNHGSES